jgi:hypothetical protein
MTNSIVDKKIIEGFRQFEANRKAAYLAQDRISMIVKESERVLPLWRMQKPALEKKLEKVEKRLAVISSKRIYVDHDPLQKSKLVKKQERAERSRDKVQREIEENEQAQIDILRLTLFAAQALKAANEGDINECIGKFQNVMVCWAKTVMPFYYKSKMAEAGKKGGPISKKPKSDLELMLTAIVSEILDNDTKPVLDWWESKPHPNTEKIGFGKNYQIGYSNGKYHYYLAGKRDVTKREIQQTMSLLRYKESASLSK